MIDRAARKLLAVKLRHLANGLITNDDFEEAVMSVKTDDKGYWLGVDLGWTLYSDFYQHNLSGSRALSRSDRRIVCRYILFLYSDLEYEWSEQPRAGFVRLLSWIVSFGQLSNNLDDEWKSQGDYEVYPFLRHSDYEKANANPKLLAGGRGQVVW